MAAAGAGAKDKIEVREDGMKIDFKNTPSKKTIVTFTEVEPDAFKLTFHQLLPDGTTHDLLLRNTDTTFSGSVYKEQCIIVRENLHIKRETAEQIWSHLSRDREFMSDSQSNDEGKRFSELTVLSHNSVVGAIHYLERIAVSLHEQEKREAAAAQKYAKEAARAASSKASKERMEALKSTPEYKEQMERKLLEQQRLDAEAAAAAEAERAKNAELPAPGTTRVRKPTSGSGIGRGGTRRPSRKYKKSKRVLRRKSRSTRRR